MCAHTVLMFACPSPSMLMSFAQHLHLYACKRMLCLICTLILKVSIRADLFYLWTMFAQSMCLDSHYWKPNAELVLIQQGCFRVLLCGPSRAKYFLTTQLKWFYLFTTTAATATSTTRIAFTLTRNSNYLCTITTGTTQQMLVMCLRVYLIQLYLPLGNNNMGAPVFSADVLM